MRKGSVRIPLKKTNTCKHRKYTYTFNFLVVVPLKNVSALAFHFAGTSTFRLHLRPLRSPSPYNRMYILYW